jgi:hypothetical protein
MALAREGDDGQLRLVSQLGDEEQAEGGGYKLPVQGTSKTRELRELRN